ncbi:hypothetical protein D9756_010569 [Leucocoprinus leucothites]|uniref:Hydrophobin n=1 Tax=Leucocoprinus leucothites TaxID=201217 RepID=A0A8H5CTK8_9AGAR|nr:hypothetical protein D9756_010569 [Leucoagaricus leucothites]
MVNFKSLIIFASLTTSISTVSAQGLSGDSISKGLKKLNEICGHSFLSCCESLKTPASAKTELEAIGVTNVANITAPDLMVGVSCKAWKMPQKSGDPPACSKPNLPVCCNGASFNYKVVFGCKTFLDKLDNKPKGQ